MKFVLEIGRSYKLVCQSFPTQNWQPVGAVTLNPERDAGVKAAVVNHDKQPLTA